MSDFDDIFGPSVNQSKANMEDDPFKEFQNEKMIVSPSSKLKDNLSVNKNQNISNQTNISSPIINQTKSDQQQKSPNKNNHIVDPFENLLQQTLSNMQENKQSPQKVMLNSQQQKQQQNTIKNSIQNNQNNYNTISPTKIQQNNNQAVNQPKMYQSNSYDDFEQSYQNIPKTVSKTQQSITNSQINVNEEQQKLQKMYDDSQYLNKQYLQKIKLLEDENEKLRINKDEQEKIQLKNHLQSKIKIIDEQQVQLEQKSKEIQNLKKDLLALNTLQMNEIYWKNLHKEVQLQIKIQKENYEQQIEKLQDKCDKLQLNLEETNEIKMHNLSQRKSNIRIPSLDLNEQINELKEEIQFLNNEIVQRDSNNRQIAAILKLKNDQIRNMLQKDNKNKNNDESNVLLDDHQQEENKLQLINKQLISEIKELKLLHKEELQIRDDKIQQLDLQLKNNQKSDKIEKNVSTPRNSLIDDIQQSKKMKDQIDEKDAQISQQKLLIQQKQQSLDQLKQEFKENSHSLTQIIDDYQNLQSIHNKQKTQLTESQIKLQECQSKITEYEEVINDQSILDHLNKTEMINNDLNNQLRVCQREIKLLTNKLTEKTNLITHLEEELLIKAQYYQKQLEQEFKEYTQQINTLNDKLIDMQIEIDQSRATVNKNTQMMMELDMLKRENKVLDQEHLILQQNISEYKDQLKNCDKIMKASNSLNDSLNKENTILKENLQEITDELNISRDEKYTLQQAIIKLNLQLKETDQQFNKSKVMNQSLQNQLKQSNNHDSYVQQAQQQNKELVEKNQLIVQQLQDQNILNNQHFFRLSSLMIEKEEIYQQLLKIKEISENQQIYIKKLEDDLKENIDLKKQIANLQEINNYQIQQIQDANKYLNDRDRLEKQREDDIAQINFYKLQIDDYVKKLHEEHQIMSQVQNTNNQTITEKQNLLDNMQDLSDNLDHCEHQKKLLQVQINDLNLQIKQEQTKSENYHQENISKQKYENMYNSLKEDYQKQQKEYNEILAINQEILESAKKTEFELQVLIENKLKDKKVYKDQIQYYEDQIQSNKIMMTKFVMINAENERLHYSNQQMQQQIELNEQQLIILQDEIKTKIQQFEEIKQKFLQQEKVNQTFYDYKAFRDDAQMKIEYITEENKKITLNLKKQMVENQNLQNKIYNLTLRIDDKKDQIEMKQKIHQLNTENDRLNRILQNSIKENFKLTK